MSRLADEYGLDVWIWYPAMDQDYSDPKTVEFALKEWAKCFRSCRGSTRSSCPAAIRATRSPPPDGAAGEADGEPAQVPSEGADVGVAAGLHAEWMDEFFAILKNEPAWLTGVVFGPQVRDSLPELRAECRSGTRSATTRTSRTARSQYPVPDWDVATR